MSTVKHNEACFPAPSEDRMQVGVSGSGGQNLGVVCHDVVLRLNLSSCAKTCFYSDCLTQTAFGELQSHVTNNDGIRA